MKRKLMDLLQAIYEEGQKHDSEGLPHEKRLLNITPDTGNFLSILVMASSSRSVLEIGTSNGYSTLWLADAVSKIKGKVTTVEVSPEKHAMANDNFSKSSVGESIKSVLEDARKFIETIPDNSVDLLFLDAERPQYIDYFEDIDRVLRLNGLLVVDNASEPKPEELAPLISLIGESGRYATQLIRIGKGEFLALKTSSKV